MNTKNLDHLRIVVHINDEDVRDRDEIYYKLNYFCENDIDRNILKPVAVPPVSIRPLNSTGCENMKAEVLLIDDKCLQLNLLSNEEDDVPYTNISHKMYFDFVSHSTVELSKRELAIVMDDLLLKHVNSTIIRFSNKQETDIIIFLDLLISFLKKRIYYQKYQLKHVKLECRDIGATMGNTGSQPAEQGLTMRADMADNNNNIDDCNNNNVQHHFANTSTNKFQYTRDLLYWLVKQYRYRFADNQGHEKLLFTFALNDHHHNAFDVKLTLFNIYTDLMKTEDRNHWRHYMDHIGDGCKGQDCNFVHSGLTICLSNHMEGIINQNTLLMFHVPTDIEMCTETTEVLQMAHAVMQNRKKKSFEVNLNQRISLKSTTCLESLLLPTKIDEEEPIPKVCPKYVNTRKTYYESSNERANRAYCAPPRNNQSAARSSLGNPGSMSFNSLSSWYRKIDERFLQLSQTREKYFDRYFDLKFIAISYSISDMYNCLESLNLHNGNHVKVQEDERELHQLFKSYHNARFLFRQLTEDIQYSEFESSLKIYLDTKMFDLNKQASKLKRKHFQLGHQLLKLTFDNIVCDFK